MELIEIFNPVLAVEIHKRLAILTPREREVFLLRQGFDRNGDGLTYERIGWKFHFVRERARQIYAKATGKLKENSGDKFHFGIPLFSCQCGKYQGKRCWDLRCDKCGKKVVRQGEIQTTLVTEYWKDGEKITVHAKEIHE